MFLDIIKQFNWMDIFVLIILFRICYIALKTGLPIEFFKLLGTIAAVYLSLHYYTIISDSIRKRVSFEAMPLDFLDFISFAALAVSGYLVFVLLRSVFYRFMKMEAVPNLNKWGGLLLGVGRGFLFVGLITFMLVISSISYLKTSVKDAYFGSRMFRVAPVTYSWLWNTVVCKLVNNEKFNKVVFEVEKDFSKK